MLNIILILRNIYIYIEDTGNFYATTGYYPSVNNEICTFCK